MSVSSNILDRTNHCKVTHSCSASPLLRWGFTTLTRADCFEGNFLILIEIHDLINLVNVTRDTSLHMKGRNKRWLERVTANSSGHYIPIEVFTVEAGGELLSRSKNGTTGP